MLSDFTFSGGGGILETSLYSPERKFSFCVIRVLVSILRMLCNDAVFWEQSTDPSILEIHVPDPKRSK